jgi:ATP-binding cassette subfamily F protein uup
MKLGFDQWDTPLDQLSGGQKKRVALARTLAGESELLILDEPTNHLDGEGILWLEQYLMRFSGAILMITHDRYFLDRVTNRIVELEGGKLFSYSGNYSGYLEMKGQREESQLASQRKRQTILKKELAWMRQGIKARGTRNKGRVERFEELKSQQPSGNEARLEVSSVSARLGKKIIVLDQVGMSYGAEPLFQNFTYTLKKRDRIGILGDNGCGKTTLLRIIAGEIRPDTGHLEIGETVKIGYFSQDNLSLDPEQKVLDYIRDIAEIVETIEGTATASQMLERFLFSPDLQHNRIGRLSGGEKRRLSLLGILMQSPNVLLLDEPTNDLDIETLTILEDYLDGFAGAVLIVSHDRYFLDRIVDHVFAFEEGQIRLYNGGYSDYLDRKKELDREKSKTEGAKDKRISAPTRSKPESKRRISFNERREFNTIDEEILKLEEAIKEMDGKIGEAATNHSLLQQLLAEKETMEQQLEFKMERWMILTELFEEVEGS